MKKFLLYIFFVFTIFLTILVVSCVYIFLKYRSWEKEFESNINTEYLIDAKSIEEVDLDERIVKFTLSLLDTESLSLEVKEIGSILFTTVDSYLGEEISLKKIYVEPSDKVWNIYFKVGYQDLELWFSFDINKDDIQSAQLYTKYVYIGPFEIGRYTDLVSLINKGIGESIVTLNENGFVGRYIENIELLEGGIVLKGSRY
ncbi:hypothetical protein A2400_00165 [candidate division WS6 bacterium RIFOXYB1_FULL_33_14]|uniref:Uncharacterized protein n=1 Tax=candidate division WS6 bacterium RIFOXYB1_FULL_33_14 TaxID=1817896 RepID=A0A1F4UH15_9BACT|nr:MAG: hypothetical protein A2400_00165 [candidate division WS6 bacterium RIFOXYB1_FULL_33_14]